METMANQIFSRNKRTHDKIYLKENRKNKPKEYFKFIYKISDPFINKVKNPFILDVGCATGDFLYFLSKKYKNASLLGIDINPDLLQKARSEAGGIKFLKADIVTGKGLPKTKFDAVFMNGVNGIFDDYQPWLNNILKLLNRRRRAYVFTSFNPYDVDVIMRVKYAGRKGQSWQSGWNIFSRKTIGDYLKKIGVKATFHEFDIKIDLPPKTSDPLRSWTIRLANGRRMIVNGTGIIHCFSLLEIRK